MLRLTPTDSPRGEAHRLVDAVNGIAAAAGALLGGACAPQRPAQAEAYIARIVDQIYSEPDFNEQYRLRCLLLQAESRIADRAWKSRIAERHIGESRARIDRQRRLIDRLSAAGCDTSEARRTLDNFILLNGLFRSFQHYLSQDAHRAGSAMLGLRRHQRIPRTRPSLRPD